jgi:protein translocase SecG subunit
MTEVLATALPWIQIALAALLTFLILAQRSDAGLGSAFGGGDTENTKHTRRGFEKFAFQASIVLSILFIASTVVTLAL